MNKLKKILRACGMSMTMFCAIPMPFHSWDDESRPLMTACLPVVGLEIGAVWALLCFILQRLTALSVLPHALAAGSFAVYPFLVTGFIHLDGFMDVTDAVKSCRDLERRREILKDSSVGAFAVISVAIVLVMSFAASMSLSFKENIPVLIFIPILSRCCSALAVTVLPTMETSQFSGRYREGIKKSHVVNLCVTVVVVCVLAAVICKVYATVLAAVLLGYAAALGRAYKNLGGMNGDIAGYSLTISELCGVCAYALVTPVMNFLG